MCHELGVNIDDVELIMEQIGHDELKGGSNILDSKNHKEICEYPPGCGESCFYDSVGGLEFDWPNKPSINDRNS